MRKIFFSFLLLVFTGATAGAQSSYRVAGTVVDGLNGSPLAKCRMALRRDDPQAAQNINQTTSTVTDSGGHFVFENVVPGKFALVARRNGYRTQALDEHYGFAFAVAVGLGKDSEHVVFRLVPSASIVGRLQDESGDPISDAQVMLFRRSAETGRTRTVSVSTSSSDHGGSYHFYDLAPGEYLLAIVARPWYSQYQQLDWSLEERAPLRDGEADLNLTFPITYYPSATDSASASSIKVRPGDQVVADMQLAAQPATVMKIAQPATDDSGPNRRQVTHELQTPIFGSPMNVYPMVSTMNNGKVSLTTGIAAGTYTLKERQFAGEDSSKNNSESLRKVKVSADGAVEYDPILEPTAVSGVVELEGLRLPLPQIALRFEKNNGEVFDARINPKGELEPFHLFPGVYTYFTISRQQVVKRLQAEGAKVAGRTIQIARAPVTLKITLADVAIDIRGTVLASDGKPLHGAMVILVPEDIEHNLNIIRRDQSDMDGTFTLRIVMPGRYKLLALQDAWDLEWSNPKVLERFYAGALALEVVAGEKVKDVEVKAQPTRE